MNDVLCSVVSYPYPDEIRDLISKIAPSEVQKDYHRSFREILNDGDSEVWVFSEDHTMLSWIGISFNRDNNLIDVKLAGLNEGCKMARHRKMGLLAIMSGFEKICERYSPFNIFMVVPAAVKQLFLRTSCSQDFQEVKLPLFYFEQGRDGFLFVRGALQ